MMKKLKLQNKLTIIIEDSINGMISAKSSGAFVVGIIEERRRAEEDFFQARCEAVRAVGEDE